MGTHVIYELCKKDSCRFNEIPSHVEYALTEKGRNLLPIFYEIAKWSVHYMEIHLS